MTHQVESITSQPKRFLSIDIFKGLTVLLMVFVNSIQIYDDIPAWTKHAGDYGLTYVDLVAPFFIYMLALNLNISYNRRVDEFGRKKALLRYLRRYLSFVGIGLVLTIYVDVNVFSLRWGTLQVLGASGLMLLPLLNLKPYVKLVVAVLFMCLHQYLLFTPISIVIYDSIEGGIFGIFSWGSMMILSSFLAEGLKKGKKYVTLYFFFGGLICVLTGMSFAYFFGISRPFISIPYILISVGIADILYCFLYYMYEMWGENYGFVKKERIFSAVGRNAFIFFLIHILIAYSIYAIFPTNTPSIIIFSLAIGHVAFIWLIAYFMNKHEIYIIV